MLTDLNPEIEQLKQQIRAIDARILDAGGDEYKKMKD